VACQIDALKDCLDYPRLRQALNTLPKTLDDTYARILENVPEGYSTQIARILNLLIWSDWDFEMDELVDAVATDLDQDPAFDTRNRMPVPRDILRLCSSLITVSSKKYSENVQLAHFSVKEYLVSNHAPEGFEFLLSETVSRSHLARLCLTYLICVSHLFKLDQSVQAIDTDKIYVEFPFVLYSSNHWMDHFRAVGTQDESLYEMVMSFFVEKHEALSFFGNLQHCEFRENGTPLYYAARGGLTRTVETLLDRGADINAGDGEALLEAVDRYHDTTVHLLLDRGADVNARDSEALMIALDQDINAYEPMQTGVYDDADDDQEITEAAYCGRDSIIQRLLDHGAHVDARDGHALIRAAESGSDMIIQLLLNAGADVNTRNGYALSVAVELAPTRTVQLLLDGGADVHAENDVALISGIVFDRSSNASVVRLLLDRGADPNTRGGEALYEAIRCRQTVIQLLLDKGADVNACYGWPLQTAVWRGDQTIIQLLLENGADVNAKDGRALEIAAKRGNDGIVRFLLENGANVTAAALLAALDNCQDTTIQLLIDRGETPGSHSGPTLTALQDVSEYGYKVLVEQGLEDRSNRSTALLECSDCLEKLGNLAQLLIDRGADTTLPGINWLDTLRAGGWSVQVVQQILEGNSPLRGNHLVSAMLDTDPQAESIVSVMLPYLSLTAAAKVPGEQQWNLLYYAAVCGSEVVTQRCLDLGVDFYARDRFKRTPMHYAALFGHLAVVVMLVQAGFDLQAPDNEGGTLLTSIGKYIKRGSDLEICEECWSGSTPPGDIFAYLSNVAQEDIADSSAD
jgi:ankyrin repeat protein